MRDARLDKGRRENHATILKNSSFFRLLDCDMYVCCVIEATADERNSEQA